MTMNTMVPSLHFEFDDTTHYGIIDEGGFYGEPGTNENIVVGFKLGSIYACIVVIVRVWIGNRCLAAREVLEVNQHTFLFVDVP